MEVAPHQTQSMVEDYQLALRTSFFEKEYESTLAHSAKILDGERGRIGHVEQLFLRFENETLQCQVDQINRELTAAVKAESKARTQLQRLCHELERLQDNCRASSCEIERLRQELVSRSNDAPDLPALVDENRRLSKELSRSRSETDSLKSQNASINTFLSQSKSLERNLNTLELQLDDEKHSHERTLARASQQAEEIATLSSELEAARRKLKEEIEVRDYAAHQKSLEWAAQRAAFEERLENWNRKLSTANNKPHSLQNQPQWQPQNPRTDESDKMSARSRAMATKQPAGRLNPELNIATPGAVRAPGKPKSSALPGDKSSFSITPFLNRTDGLRGSPISSDNDTDDLHLKHFNDSDGAAQSNTLNAVKKAHHSRRPNSSSLERSPSGDLATPENSSFRKRQPKKTNAPHSNQGSERSSLLIPHTNLGQFRTKKRKLGNQRDNNFLDDDDDDDEMDDLRDIRKQGRKLTGTGRNLNLQPSTLRVGPASRNRGFGGQAEFSPLKKDKKRL